MAEVLTGVVLFQHVESFEPTTNYPKATSNAIGAACEMLPEIGVMLEVCSLKRPSAHELLHTMQDHTNDLLCAKTKADFSRKRKAEVETSESLSRSLWQVQKELDNRMRSLLITWLVEVVYRFGLGLDTLEASVQLIDRVLFATSVLRDEFQLLGIVCLSLACKLCTELEGIPEVEQCLSAAQERYTKKQFMDYEDHVLATLKFDVLWDQLPLYNPHVPDSLATTFRVLYLYSDRRHEHTIEVVNHAMREFASGQPISHSGLRFEILKCKQRTVLPSLSYTKADSV
jgi:hypothetical protein